MSSNKKSALLYIGSWTPAICIMIIIFSLSNRVAADSAGTSSSLTDFVLNIINQFTDKPITADSVSYEHIHHLIRKTAHFLEYMALGCALVLPFALIFVRHAKPGKPHALKTLHILLCSEFFSVFYACSDELHQLFVEGRDGSLKDVSLDSLGAFTGICIGFLFWWIGRLVIKKYTALTNKI